MYCPNCGKENKDTVAFCQFCGKKIETKVKKQAPPQEIATSERASKAKWNFTNKVKVIVIFAVIVFFIGVVSLKAVVKTPRQNGFLVDNISEDEVFWGADSMFQHPLLLEGSRKETLKYPGYEIIDGYELSYYYDEDDGKIFFSDKKNTNGDLEYALSYGYNEVGLLTNIVVFDGSGANIGRWEIELDTYGRISGKRWVVYNPDPYLLTPSSGIGEDVYRYNNDGVLVEKYITVGEDEDSSWSYRWNYDVETKQETLTSIRENRFVKFVKQYDENEMPILYTEYDRDSGNILYTQNYKTEILYDDENRPVCYTTKAGERVVWVRTIEYK